MELHGGDGCGWNVEHIVNSLYFQGGLNLLGNEARKVIRSHKIPYILRNFDWILEVLGSYWKCFKQMADMIQLIFSKTCFCGKCEKELESERDQWAGCLLVYHFCSPGER